MLLQIEHAYEPPEPEDGERFLIDRLWSRGLKKDSLWLTGSAKEVAQSLEGVDALGFRISRG